MNRLSSLYKSRMMKCGNQYNHGYITHTGKGVYLIKQIILWHYRNDVLMPGNATTCAVLY